MKIFLFFLTASCLTPFISSWPLQQRDLSGEVGETVRLPCAVNKEKCGNLHSIKWYRGSTRIFVFSEMAKVSRPEGEYLNRTVLVYDPTSTESFLEVKQLQVGDEAVYKCEITYLEVRDGCQVVQFLNLTTLIKPDYLKITRDDGSEVVNASVIGPVTEDDKMVLTCESGGGKPIPLVQWWNGTNLMQGEYQTEPLSNGIGTGRSRVRVIISRGDLGAKYECRASSLALEIPLKAWLLVEVNVRPLKVELLGTADQWNQGSEVSLSCEARGARPAANVTWFNGTTQLPNHYVTSNTKQQADGTFDTLSKLTFTATRFENEQSLTCEASNEIMISRTERPMRQSVTLQVMYPPLVNVKPSNSTVNESTDVLLFCHYEANPATLTSVKWLKDGEEIGSDPDHYEGGTTEQTTLLIKNATRYDHGNYTCVLENKVASAESSNAVIVSVHFKPVVEVTMSPSSGVSESSRENITLTCEVRAGRPETLKFVRWYLDGILLKQLPDCSSPNSSFCDVNPAKLMLEEVVRSFHGNYSCVGMNEAGWGDRSPEAALQVFYAPSGVRLSYYPERVVKKAPMNLTCHVEDPGRPSNTTFRWTRGSQILTEVTGPVYAVDQVTLQTESNFTCTAINLGGENQSSTVFIKVYAPPTFIERLPPYYGALMTSSSINITCRVECSPLCSIDWLKNGQRLDTSGPRYSVYNTVIPPDPRTNDFESVQSTLMWNMTAWPGGRLDRHADNANYTCYSTGNAVGSGVKSHTFFSVEYPPENLTVSNQVVNVIESNVPEKVVCSAKAYPEASYQWRREGDTDLVMKGNALILNYPVRRRNGGNYVCEAYNRHGNNTVVTYINVLYKPECGISQTELDGKLVLVCTAHANPTDLDFTWKIKNENETIEEGIEKNDLQSFLTLETRIENFRTYLCFANNSVGVSVPCERDVTGNLNWWQRMENENLMILIAIIIFIIVMVLIICIIIILVCRKKRANDKFNNSVELEEKENSLDKFIMNLYNVDSGGEGAAYRWPLRPGVMVHVNSKHSLASGGSLGQASSQTHRRALSVASLTETQASRAQRIKHMFSGDSRYKSDTLPANPTPVVSFRKMDNTNKGASRKRKKPGQGPNPSGNPDKSDLNSSPNDALLQPDPDRVFYENLPFHGIQNPPNKDLEDRPPSELSDYAVSSGYGSTRSHRPPAEGAELSPDGKSTQPKLKAVRKCSTIRQASNRNRPQFRSLRRLASLTKKNRTKEKNNNNVKETTMEPPNIPAPDVPRLTSDISSSKANPPLCPKIRPTSFSKPPVPTSPPPEPPRIINPQPSPDRPVPAPRKRSPSAPPRPPPPRHTYQNVPVAVEPNAAQHIQTSGLPAIAPKNFGLVYQPLKSSTGRSKSGRDGYHGGYPQLPSPPPPPSYNGSLRSSRPAPPVYQSNHRHNKDYAIKFHDIGREIDV